VFEMPAEARDAVARSLGEALASEPGVRVALLFGSFARGEPFRDLDVGVEFGGPFSLLDVGRLATRLWSAAGEPAFEIDVVPLDDAPASFRLEVAETGRLLRERHEGDAVEFAVAARRDAIDLAAALEDERP
jgi:predicted nucleotidyltransferase